MKIRHFPFIVETSNKIHTNWKFHAHSYIVWWYSGIYLCRGLTAPFTETKFFFVMERYLGSSVRFQWQLLGSLAVSNWTNKFECDMLFRWVHLLWPVCIHFHMCISSPYDELFLPMWTKARISIIPPDACDECQRRT